MRTKKGNPLHAEGNKLPFATGARGDPAGYAAAVAAALRAEAESAGHGAKMVMRWTGASERAVKGWLAGERGPNGEHLIALLAESDAVLAAVLGLAGRVEDDRTHSIEEARHHLAAASAALDRATGRTA